MNFYVDRLTLKSDGEWPTETRSAILASIDKWSAIIQWHKANPDTNGRPLGAISVSTCALCHAFFYNDDGDCVKCPVYLLTGARYCHLTPYDKYYKSTSANDLLRYANEELNFLKTVLATFDRENAEA